MMTREWRSLKQELEEVCIVKTEFEAMGCNVKDEHEIISVMGESRSSKHMLENTIT